MSNSNIRSEMLFNPYETKIKALIKTDKITKLKNYIKKDDLPWDIVDSNGFTILHWACFYGSKNIIRYVIKRNLINPLIYSLTEESCIDVAVSCNQDEILKYLLKSKIVFSKESKYIFNSIDSNDFELFNLWITHPNFDLLINNEENMTILIYICFRGRQKMLDLVTTRFEDKLDAHYLSLQDIEGNILLHYACRNKMDLNPILDLDNLNPNICNNHGQSPIYLCAKYNIISCTEQLLQRSDLNLNVINNLSLTPLMMAVLYEHEDIVKLLLTVKNINVSIADSNGNTALQMAAEKNNRAIIYYLVNYNLFKQKMSLRRSSELTLGQPPVPITERSKSIR